MKTAQLLSPAPINAKLVRRLSRAYDRAIHAEENAPTLTQAYRLAAISERCLRQLQAARAGLPLPAPRLPHTARNLGKQGLAALAMIGRAIKRAVNAAAALRKAQVANAARKAVQLSRRAMHRTVRKVVSLVLRTVVINTPKKEIIVMKAPTLAARIHAGQSHNYCQVSIDGYDGFYTDSVDGGGGLLQYTAHDLALRVELRADRFVFTGGPHGEHCIAADELITNAARLLAHWKGYCENAERYVNVRSLVQNARDNGAEAVS